MREYQSFAKIRSGQTYPCFLSLPIRSALCTLAIGKASWEGRPRVELGLTPEGTVTSMAKQLASALAARGGLQQVVIRGAEGGLSGDASHIVNAGNVPNVDSA